MADRLSKAASLNTPIRIAILQTEVPLALSISSGDIFISRGFIRYLRTEESFAFVIAHELSHALLEHHLANKPDSAFELSADNLALNIILRAGYPAESIFEAVIDSYPRDHAITKDSIASYFGNDLMVHPSLQERIKNLKDKVGQIGVIPANVQITSAESYAGFIATL
jgi:Zn-dependent protease with chaperone function